ncbi:snare associated Golgi protein-domain-containing protein [Mariannaea sp. PMI_226]|nr:snare associated Golgi protein-domain-containing protein [Mariannaea sp. PMI_226]
MPADYQSTAQALAISPSRGSSPSSPNLPPWSGSSAARRRLSNPMGRPSSHGSDSFPRRIAAQIQLLGEQTLKMYMRLTPLQRILSVLGLIAIGICGILAIIYSHAFFAWLDPIAKKWRELPGGWVLIFLMIFITSFPPVVGYSTAATISGFVYGFPWGWPVVSAGCTLGALGAFMASRTILSSYVDRMVGKDHRFVALGQVLRQEGVWYLTAIRFCPLPFSLSNGFLATIPSITPLAFFLSTALSSPKLLVHVFIGSRLALLAEDGEKMSAGAKAVNYLSMALGGALGLGVGYIIYRRTMARAAELAREEIGGAAAAEEGDGGYEDAESSTLMDPDDAAELMSDDDISLWGRDADSYHDDEDDDEPQKKKRGQD